MRAYLDLGFEVELVQIATQADHSEPSSDLTPVAVSRVIEPLPLPSLFGRLMFRAGVTHRAAVAYYFQKHPLVSRALEARRMRDPNAVFHLEGESLANVVPWLPKATRAIWSLHDLPSTVSAATTKIVCDAEGRQPSVAERRELRFARRVERFMARNARLMLCIALHDSERLRDELGCEAAEYLPMSIPNDGARRDNKTWLDGGRLRILHLGCISHLPSYRSLEFLFEQVFPRLPEQVLERIALDVVGRVDPENPRARRILTLAAPYANVALHGFVDDVVPFYQSSDLQVVASTDASGLRTRIIESFAYGLPVMSTSVGARGIAGLKADEHFMVADDAAQFAIGLTRLLDSPGMLERFSRSGQEFYEKHQSRAIVATALSQCLQKHFGINAAR